MKTFVYIIAVYLYIFHQCLRLRPIRRSETGNFWWGPATFYTFLYKLMFEFLKILIWTGNFFSLALNAVFHLYIFIYMCTYIIIVMIIIIIIIIIIITRVIFTSYQPTDSCYFAFDVHSQSTFGYCKFTELISPWTKSILQITFSNAFHEWKVVWFDSNITEVWSKGFNVQYDGILPKGPYLPCLHMADRALLAGYPRIRLHWFR